MYTNFKRIGLPFLAVLVMLMLFSAPANAGVRFGVYVGAPVYPYYSYYSNPYPVHHYTYYSYPAYPYYTYTYRTYAYPRLHVRLYHRRYWSRW